MTIRSFPMMRIYTTRHTISLCAVAKNPFISNNEKQKVVTRFIYMLYKYQKIHVINRTHREVE